ncbi:hypothetical protein Tco_1557987, partial [Tanacetum coccineum]
SRGYKVVTDLMMHGPYGAANLGAPCMKNSPCSKHFPKKYNDKTLFDRIGHTQYHRRDTGVHVMKSESRACSSNIFPKDLIAFSLRSASRLEKHLLQQLTAALRLTKSKTMLTVVSFAHMKLAGEFLTFQYIVKNCLLGDDKEWDIALAESTVSTTSAEIRTLFA